MDKLEKLVKHENNDFSEYHDGIFLFCGTTSIEIEIDNVQDMQKGDYYKDGKNIYKVLGKQYDNRDNIVLLCEEV